jgi:hypothetical protein
MASKAKADEKNKPEVEEHWGESWLVLGEQGGCEVASTHAEGYILTRPPVAVSRCATSR